MKVAALLFLTVIILAGVVSASIVLTRRHDRVVAAKQQQDDWQSKYDTARAAYNRAAEYYSAGTLLYEPRFLDFEKAFDAIPKQQDHGLKTDKRGNLIACAMALDGYRQEKAFYSKFEDSADDFASSIHDDDARIRADARAGLANAEATLYKTTQNESKYEAKISHCVHSGSPS